MRWVDRLGIQINRPPGRGGAATPAAAGQAGVAEDGSESLLMATLSFGQTQLLAQIADETSVDGRTMGVLAFNGALLAADVAAKDILGRWWWTGCAAVGIATLPCLRSVVTKDTDLGPLAATFYASYGADTSLAPRKQLLADLGVAFTTNARRIAGKRRRLRVAIFALIAGLCAASSLIAADRPTTIDEHAQRTASKFSADPAGAGVHARAVAVAARRSERNTPLVIPR